MADGFYKLPNRFAATYGKLVGPSAWLVYTIMRGYANDNGEGCFASITRLADESGMSRRHVMTLIETLVQHGLISRADHHQGRKTTYLLASPDALMERATGEAHFTSKLVKHSSLVKCSSPPLVKHSSPELVNCSSPYQEPRTRTKEQEPKTKTPSTPKPDDTQFERFWAHYPKRVDKQAALRAFRKLRPTDDLLDTIITHLGEMCTSADWAKDGGRYIPNPTTYLNNRRWEAALDTSLLRGGNNNGHDRALAGRIRIGETRTVNLWMGGEFRHVSQAWNGDEWETTGLVETA